MLIDRFQLRAVGGIELDALVRPPGGSGGGGGIKKAAVPLHKGDK